MSDNLIKKNLFENIPESFPEEIFDIILQKPGIRIERIISRGNSSPENFWYDQENDELAFLIQGESIIEFAGGNEIKMYKGDFIFIPAHNKHRVKWTNPDINNIWIAVHL